jgi:hypothetical protein
MPVNCVPSAPFEALSLLALLVQKYNTDKRAVLQAITYKDEYYANYCRWATSVWGLKLPVYEALRAYWLITYKDEYYANYCRCKGLTAYAHVCSRMLTYAHVCSRVLTYAADARTSYQAPHLLCWRMLTYADVCWRMLTHSADARTLSGATSSQVGSCFPTCFTSTEVKTDALQQVYICPLGFTRTKARFTCFTSTTVRRRISCSQVDSCPLGFTSTKAGFAFFTSTEVKRRTHFHRWTPVLYALLVQKHTLLALPVQK